METGEETADVQARVNEPRSRSSPKFQERSIERSGYGDERERWKLQTSKLHIREQNRKLSGEKGQYRSLMLGRVAAK